MLFSSGFEGVSNTTNSLQVDATLLNVSFKLISAEEDNALVNIARDDAYSANAEHELVHSEVDPADNCQFASVENEEPSDVVSSCELNTSPPQCDVPLNHTNNTEEGPDTTACGAEDEETSLPQAHTETVQNCTQSPPLQNESSHVSTQEPEERETGVIATSDSSTLLLCSSNDTNSAAIHLPLENQHILCTAPGSDINKEVDDLRGIYSDKGLDMRKEHKENTNNRSPECDAMANSVDDNTSIETVVADNLNCTPLESEKDITNQVDGSLINFKESPNEKKWSATDSLISVDNEPTVISNIQFSNELVTPVETNDSLETTQSDDYEHGLEIERPQQTLTEGLHQKMCLPSSGADSSAEKTGNVFDL